MVIDFHTHIFPDALAGKVLPKLSDASGIIPHTDGTFNGTVNKFREWNIDGAVFLNIATTPKQQNTINNVASEINKKKNFYAFGSVHPFAGDALSELDRIKSLGLKGIKLHPEYQDFYVDDPRVFSVYDKARALDLCVVFHAGVDIGIAPPVHSTPDRFLSIIKNFPGLKVVAAHLGGFSSWDMVEYYLTGKDIYFDTSMTAGYLETDRMKRIVKRHGVDKILFGSDCPWASSKTAFDGVLSLGLSSSDNDMIFGQNALNLLT